MRFSTNLLFQKVYNLFMKILFCVNSPTYCLFLASYSQVLQVDGSYWWSRNRCNLLSRRFVLRLLDICLCFSSIMSCIICSCAFCFSDYRTVCTVIGNIALNRLSLVTSTRTGLIEKMTVIFNNYTDDDKKKLLGNEGAKRGGKQGFISLETPTNIQVSFSCLFSFLF